jgi:hypothetical protein
MWIKSITASEAFDSMERTSKKSYDRTRWYVERRAVLSGFLVDERSMNQWDPQSGRLIVPLQRRHCMASWSAAKSGCNSVVLGGKDRKERDGFVFSIVSHALME